MSKDNTQLTEFEHYLLQIVAKGRNKKKWSWHSIGVRVVYEGREGEIDMLKALKGLEARGLVKRYSEVGQPEDHWELTAKGEQYL